MYLTYFEFSYCSTTLYFEIVTPFLQIAVHIMNKVIKYKKKRIRSTRHFKSLYKYNGGNI